MSEANLNETLLSYKLRRNALNLEISILQSRKTLGTYSQADRKAIKAKDEEGVRQYFRALYQDDADMKLQYKDYTEIPDFEEEMDKIAAKYNDEIADLTAWENTIDEQLLADDAELQEVNAYIESIKSMLQSNIQNDYNYGLNS